LISTSAERRFLELGAMVDISDMVGVSASDARGELGVVGAVEVRWSDLGEGPSLERETQAAWRKADFSNFTDRLLRNRPSSKTSSQKPKESDRTGP
jgi:hypothetical protein